MSLLTTFDPFRDFDRVSSEFFNALSRRATSTSMPVDAYRQGTHYVVKVDLPGVDAGTIDVTVDRNVLRVQASRDWQPEEGDVILAAERPRGNFARQLVLSDDIDTNAIKADYRDGVLTIQLPIAEAARPRKVAVGTGAAGAPKPVEATSTEHQAA
jgi:HSP20 family protein